MLVDLVLEVDGGTNCYVRNDAVIYARKNGEWADGRWVQHDHDKGRWMATNIAILDNSIYKIVGTLCSRSSDRFWTFIYRNAAGYAVTQLPSWKQITVTVNTDPVPVKHTAAITLNAAHGTWYINGKEVAGVQTVSQGDRVSGSITAAVQLPSTSDVTVICNDQMTSGTVHTYIARKYPVQVAVTVPEDPTITVVYSNTSVPEVHNV